ncbi:MAG: protein translocase subunit SecF [Candidatus Nomurabacteria bacterium]|nr:protein translocase subunit SecF [Candidatus Nomurabacteria bacterium]
MFIINNKWWFVSFSAALVIVAIVATSIFGINFGVEFTGGTVTEVQYEQRPNIEQITEALSGFDFSAQVQTLGDNAFVIRTRELSDADKQVLIASVQLEQADAQIVRSNTIGPSVGRELQSKSWIAIVAVAILIILYVAFVFRRVSRPVSSWKYGTIAVVALLHDIIIPVGVFAILGWEVGTLFIIGLLSILGLSVNDTIVVFDRVRERLGENAGKIKEPFEKTVGFAIKQTIARSLNTSLTLLVVLLVLWFVGPESTKTLAVVLMIGTVVGTYSSIFLASPLLVDWQKKTR